MMFAVVQLCKYRNRFRFHFKKDSVNFYNDMILNVRSRDDHKK